MLILPYARILFFAIFSLLLPSVDAKGGGGKGGGGGGSKSSKGSGTSKGTKSKPIKHTVIGANGARSTECRDSVTNQVVPCPKNNRATVIAVAVVFSVVGAVLLGLLVAFFIRRRRQNRREREDGSKSTPVPDTHSEVSTKAEYTPLEQKDHV